jgi:hypothetical protein
VVWFFVPRIDFIFISYFAQSTFSFAASSKPLCGCSANWLTYVLLMAELGPFLRSCAREAGYEPIRRTTHKAVPEAAKKVP